MKVYFPAPYFLKIFSRVILGFSDLIYLGDVAMGAIKCVWVDLNPNLKLHRTFQLQAIQVWMNDESATPWRTLTGSIS